MKVGPIIRSFEGGSPVILVDNKIDQQPFDIDRSGLRDKYPSIKAIVEIFCVTCEGIESCIREQFDAIHHTIQGLQVEEKVPLPDHPELPPVDYEWLRDMEQKGISEFLPPGLTESISVSRLLNGVEPAAARYKHDARGGDTYYQFYHSQVGIAGDSADVEDGIHFGHHDESPN